jgi:hypothetical protein
MEENILHCGMQRKKTCSVMGYNAEDFSVLDPSFLLCCIVGYSTPHKILLWCRIQRKKISFVVGYNGKKLLPILRFFSVVSHNGKNLFCGIPQQRKTFSIVSHNGKNSSVVSHNGKKPLLLYPTTPQNLKLK